MTEKIASTVDKNRVSSHAFHGHLKGDSGPKTGFFEKKSEHPPRECLAIPLRLFTDFNGLRQH
jgi:hypothetical protein